MYHKPIFPFLMRTSEQRFNASFYGYINGDILLSPTLFTLLSILTENRSHLFDKKPFLIAGRVNEVLDFNIDTSSLDAFNRSFSENYARGKTRNPYSAVSTTLFFPLLRRIISSIRESL